MYCRCVCVHFICSSLDVPLDLELPRRSFLCLPFYYSVCQFCFIKNSSSFYCFYFVSSESFRTSINFLLLQVLSWKLSDPILLVFSAWLVVVGCGWFWLWCGGVERCLTLILFIFFRLDVVRFLFVGQLLVLCRIRYVLSICRFLTCLSHQRTVAMRIKLEIKLYNYNVSIVLDI